MSNLNKFQRNIQDHVIGIGKSDIPSPERDILRLLYLAWKRAAGLETSEGPIGRVTQSDISSLLPNLGSHRKHEYERSNESTLRQVRQIIRDLRTKRWAPILSNINGYWIPQSETEAREYLNRSEHEVKARVMASFETYKVMRESLGISSDYFEGQGKLIDTASFRAEIPSKTIKGNSYEVYRIAGGRSICTCPGFKYRKKCRHIEMSVKNEQRV